MPASTQPVSDALKLFVGVPTMENRDKLFSAADAYREAWIVKQAMPDEKSNIKTKNRSLTSSYSNRVFEVKRVVDRVPIILALQQRTSVHVPKPWWVLSWRTNYSVGGPNRRFYFAKGSFWSMPIETALEMLAEMEGLGGMDGLYNDWRMEGSPAVVGSTELSSVERGEYLQQITGPDENWGENPFFVVCSDPNPHWKKLLILNREIGQVTFRSVTTDHTYRPRIDWRPDGRWSLDNSMMDGNVQHMKELYPRLKAYASSSNATN